MARRLLIAGGGIAGLAGALALQRTGWQCAVYERAGARTETGAGVQLGPNATRQLHGWGLDPALAAAADAPDALQVRDAVSGRNLARMRLGNAFRERYGAPYLVLHRADLQRVLLDAARSAGALLRLGAPVSLAEQAEGGAWLQLDDETLVNGDALLVADGLWSTLRRQLLRDAGPRFSGHLAYRTLIPSDAVPPSLRANEVSVWLGPRLHVVAYPVRHGAWLNLVAIVEGSMERDSQDWDARGEARDLHAAMGSVASSLRELLDAAPQWRVWALHDRPPVASPQDLARGRIALAGDAAHPMLPYLAQGAAMAIEDARALADALAGVRHGPRDVEEAVARYAQARWKRNARVQKRASRNGRIFHATGLMRLGRDIALRTFGPRLLDVPWLYGTT